MSRIAPWTDCVARPRRRGILAAEQQCSRAPGSVKVRAGGDSPRPGH
jgi:hypothetical protein